LSGQFIPGIPDVKALDDVVNDITELSDTLDVDQAVAFRVALVSHLAAVRLAIDALDMQLVKVMELPRTEGGWVHIVRRKKEKVRFDHGAIARRVRELAVIDENGDGVTFPRVAAEQAVAMMSDLYLSDSSKAKIGALKVLDIDRSDVESFERGDLYVDVTPLLSEIQE
jgi:hypothetical protein